MSRAGTGCGGGTVSEGREGGTPATGTHRHRAGTGGAHTTWLRRAPGRARGAEVKLPRAPGLGAADSPEQQRGTTSQIP